MIHDINVKYPSIHEPSFVLNFRDTLKLENFALIYLKSFQSPNSFTRWKIFDAL